MDCTACEEKIYYTGEHHPTGTPQRFYACKNKHMYLVYGQKDEDVIWGDHSVHNTWATLIRTPGPKDGLNEYKMIGKIHT